MIKLILLLIVNIKLVCEIQSEPYLFEFEKNGKKSTLFGSNHYAPLSKIPKLIKKNILKHKVLVGEVNETPADMINQKTFKKLLQKNKKTNYFSLLDNTQKKLVRLFAKMVPFYKRGVKLDSLTPGGIFVFYHSGYCAQGMDCKMNKIFAKKGTVIGLEDFNFCPSKMSLQDLKESIDSPSHSAFIDKIYLQGMVEKFSTTSSLEEPIIKLRNQYWLPKIMDLHEQYGEEVIFMVGVSHLIGKHGILNFLQNQNFTIRRSDKRGVFKPYNIAVAQKKLIQSSSDKKQQQNKN